MSARKKRMQNALSEQETQVSLVVKRFYVPQTSTDNNVVSFGGQHDKELPKH